MERYGYVYGNIGECSNKSLLSIASDVGNVMRESNPKTLAYTTDDFILNIGCQYESEKDYDLHPHSRKHIYMHSESSASKLDFQPDFIFLYAREIGDLDDGNTLIKSMKSITNRLDDETIDILSKTYYKNYDSQIPIIRSEIDRMIISIRDHGEKELHFRNEFYNEENVEHALKLLFSLMYEREGMRKICWREGDVCIFDNKRFLHARSKISMKNRARILQRIKIR